MKQPVSRSLLLAPLLALAVTAASAQTAAPAAANGKKELIARILKVQQPGVEAMARDLARQPANELLNQVADFLDSQVPADKREALAKGAQQDAEKFFQDIHPLVRERAFKLAPTTIGALLEEKLTEEELRQVAAMLESPAFGKYQALGGDMQRVLLEKLVPELKPQVDARLRALDESLARRLGVQPALAQPTGAAPAATPAPAAANAKPGTPAAAAAKPPAKKQ